MQWLDDAYQTGRTPNQIVVVLTQEQSFALQHRVLINSLLLAIAMKRVLVVIHKDTDQKHIQMATDSVLDFSVIWYYGMSETAYDKTFFWSKTWPQHHYDYVACGNLSSCMYDCCSMHQFSCIIHDGDMSNSILSDIQLLLSNPTYGPWLDKIFYGKPFFFLSHFLWSNSAQMSRSVRVKSIARASSWDRVSKLGDLKAQFHLSDEYLLIGVAGQLLANMKDLNVEDHIPETGVLDSAMLFLQDFVEIARQLNRQMVILCTSCQDYSIEKMLKNMILHCNVTVLTLEHSVANHTHSRPDLLDFEILGISHVMIGSLAPTTSLYGHWFDKAVVGRWMEISFDLNTSRTPIDSLRSFSITTSLPDDKKTAPVEELASPETVVRFETTNAFAQSLMSVFDEINAIYVLPSVNTTLKDILKKNDLHDFLQVQ